MEERLPLPTIFPFLMMSKTWIEINLPAVHLANTNSSTQYRHTMQTTAWAYNRYHFHFMLPLSV